MTCNSSFVAEFDVECVQRYLDRSKDRYESKNRSADRSHRASFKIGVPELLLSRILDASTPGDHGMKHFLALVIFSCVLASSNAAAPLDRIRIAQTRAPAECVSNCNSANFSCAQNCGLSGSCVARCTAEAATCKARCGDLK